MNRVKTNRTKLMAMTFVFAMLQLGSALNAQDVILYDNLAYTDVWGAPPGSSETDSFMLQQFFTSDSSALLQVTVQLQRVGSQSNRPVHVEIWEDKGNESPGKMITRLGTVNIASLSTAGQDVTFDKRIDGLRTNSFYFIVFDMSDAMIESQANSFRTAFASTAEGTNGAAKVLGTKTTAATPTDAELTPLNRFVANANYLRMKIVAENPAISSAPQPEDGETDVDRDAVLSWTPGESTATVDGHILYLSENLDDVSNGIGGVTLSAEHYSPERLDFNKTYYWRVDEVAAPPESTVFKGNVWSFTTEPFSYPIANITATASGAIAFSVPENTVNGSGLVDDLHGTSPADMWISGGIPATIAYAFDRAYKLQEMWIWNSNQLIESFVGFGAKDVVIEHSLNGTDWTVLDGVPELAQAPGTDGYAANSVIDFGGAMAQYVRMTINSVHGVATQASLSEVRFLYKPVSARDPKPANGAAEDTLDTVLSWRPGREAGSHQVFLSGAMGEVLDESALIASTLDASLDLSGQDLKYSSTYYWKVTEVNDLETPNAHAGNLWHFNAPEFIAVDDMETYRDEEFLEIWAHWVDGVGDPANGSIVGNENEAETNHVSEGDQSLPMLYDNGPETVSAATRTFDPPLDWVRGDPEVLSLFFLGDPTVVRNELLNDPAPLYVVITDSSGQTVQVDYPDPAATHITSWTEWVIPVTDLGGVNLSSVQSMTIGIGGDGEVAKGKMFFDNIRIGTPMDQEPQ